MSQTSDEAEQKHHSLLPTQPTHRTVLLRWGQSSGGFQLSLTNGADISIPAILQAAQKDLTPSRGRTSRRTARWSCSTILLRYFLCRMTIAVLWVWL